MPPPRSRGSCSARPNRKASSAAAGLRRAAQPSRPRRARLGGGPGRRTGGGSAGRGRLSPCARARPPGPGAAPAATARRPPPRRERPAAASSSALPPARRRPTNSSSSASAASAAADSHPRGADRRTGPGPSRWLLRAAAVTARFRASPAPRRLSASSSDSATSSGHPGTRRKCLATRGRNRRRPPHPGGASRGCPGSLFWPPRAPPGRPSGPLGPRAGRPWASGAAARTHGLGLEPLAVPDPRALRAASGRWEPCDLVQNV